jgi:hypothetical protein
MKVKYGDLGIMTPDQNDLFCESLQEAMKEMDRKWLKKDMLGRIMLGTSFIAFPIISFLIVPIFAIFKNFRLVKIHILTIYFPFCFVLYHSIVVIFFIVKYALCKIYIYFGMSLDKIKYQNMTRNVTLILMIVGYCVALFVLINTILPSSLGKYI